MVDQSPTPSSASPDAALREAAPAYADLEARRARAGVAAALFGDDEDEDGEAERLAVGRYEIDSRLGAGGMGVVYRAHDPDLDRPVAVKLLHAESSADDKARARMLREARALAKLSHPNVITVYDVGTEDGQVFVAMELVAGLDLRRWLDQHRGADWADVLELFIAAGRGLEAAHQSALIHRDFKPENVLVGDDGRVRVLDFGLARTHRPIDAATAEDRDRAPSPSVVQTDGGERGADAEIAHLPTAAFSRGLTETGALIGTPLYMAPELYAGRPADERSDQFAYCASLYEGLYRQLPFGSRNLSAHVAAVTEGKVIAPPADAAVPARLWTILARGLEADPEARHEDMGTLLAALEREAAQPALTELPERGGGLRWLGPVAVAVAVVVGLAGLGLGLGLGLGWFGGAEPPAVARDDTSARDAVDPPVEVAVADPTAEAEAEAATALPLDAELDDGAGEVEVAAGEVEVAAGETGTAGELDEASTDAGASSSAPDGPELHGWCHLHEDRYTLLLRSNGRRGSFEHRGACYTCRVERRRSRTRNFSPRDCAGYSLCGEASAGACK